MSSLPRILFVNTYVDAVGGAETYMLGLADELREHGHEVALFGTCDARDEDTDTLRVVQRPEWDYRRVFQDAPVRRAFAAFAKRFRPDVIHVHNLYSLGLDILDAMEEVGVPVVQTVHDFSVLCPNSWCVRGDGKPCQGGAGAQCFEHDCWDNAPYDTQQVLQTKLRLARTRDVVDVAIAPSMRLVELLREHGLRDVRQLPYFVDAEEFAFRTEGRDAHQLLFLGRLVPEKGLEVLVEAMETVVQEEPNARLTVLGSGIVRNALIAQARRLGLHEAIQFVPKVPHAEVRAYLAKAGALVVPSRWSENSPVSIYESLACGLPVVGSDIGGIPELVRPGETGWRAKPGDAKALGRALVAAIRTSDEERARLGQNGRDFALACNRESHLKTIRELYAEAIERGPSAAKAGVLCDDDLLTTLARLTGGGGDNEEGPAAQGHPRLPLRKRVTRKLRGMVNGALGR